MTERTRAIRPCQRFEGHTEWVEGVIHLPGGQRIMTCSHDGSLRVWNLQSGQKIGHDWRDGDDAVYAIALSPDGKKVVSGGAGGVLRLWDIDTGKVITKWPGNRDLFKCVYWSRDGGRVLSGSWDGTARVWNVDSGETILAIKTGLHRMEAVIYSPDETMIATGGESDSESKKEFLKIWDAKTGKLVINLKGHTNRVYCLAWTANGSTLISGSSDSSIRTWNTTTWQQMTENTNSVFRITISPDGRILASASFDETVQLWNLENSQPIGLPFQPPRLASYLSFSVDGKLLATGCWDNNIYTWDVAAIVREADNDVILNPNDSDKSLRDVVATRRLVQRRHENARRLPSGFFDDSPHSPGSHRPPPSSTLQHVPGRTLLARASSLFGRTRHNTHDALPQPLFPVRIPDPFSAMRRKRNDGGIGLQERHPTVVIIPLAQGNPRNFTAREVRMKQEKEKKKKAEEARKKKEEEKARAANTASAGSSWPPQPSQSSVTQQSGEAAQTQPTSSIAPAVAATSGATTSTTSSPGVMITDAGCWTRFRLFICCVSAQYTDGHH